MTKRRKKGDKFAHDEKTREYENPNPNTIDPDARVIGEALSKLSGREKTAIQTNWPPTWLKRAKLNPFKFFFPEDKLAVDFFNRDREEMDALQDDFTQAQRQEIAHKTVLCSEHGIAYLVLGPDDELDLTQIAAKIGKTTFKRGTTVNKTATAGAAAGDGISEEDI